MLYHCGRYTTKRSLDCKALQSVLGRAFCRSQKQLGHRCGQKLLKHRRRRFPDSINWPIYIHIDHSLLLSCQRVSVVQGLQYLTTKGCNLHVCTRKYGQCACEVWRSISGSRFHTDLSSNPPRGNETSPRHVISHLCVAGSEIQFNLCDPITLGPRSVHPGCPCGTKDPHPADLSDLRSSGSFGSGAERARTASGLQRATQWPVCTRGEKRIIVPFCVKDPANGTIFSCFCKM